MGDMNAKVGNNNNGYELAMGKNGLGTMNGNGERFADVCADNNLVIGGTVFPHKPIHKATWISPDHTTEKQIDHICKQEVQTLSPGCTSEEGGRRRDRPPPTGCKTPT